LQDYNRERKYHYEPEHSRIKQTNEGHYGHRNNRRFRLYWRRIASLTITTSGRKCRCSNITEQKGQKVSDTHEHLRKIYDLEFEDLNAEDVASRCDVVFTAVPHGTAMQVVPTLIEEE